MESKSTQERNEAMALFMGMEKIDEYTFRIGKFPNDHIDRGRLKYHSSWDWIMPVVEKVENVYAKGNPTIRIIGNNCAIIDNGVFGGISLNYSRNICNIIATSKLEAVFLAVSDFCLYYNKTTK